MKGSLLVLGPDVALQTAKDILWRRETDRVGSDLQYQEQTSPTPNTVLIKTLRAFEGMDYVLYVDFPEAGKLKSPSAAQLAVAAINSARARSDDRDGISYLLSAKASGVVTRLTPEYERTILKETKTKTLKQARDKLKAG